MFFVSGTADLTGAIDGVNRLFVAQTSLPSSSIIYVNGLARVAGAATSNGYTLDGANVVLGEPLVVGDILAIYVPDGASAPGPEHLNPGGPRPSPGVAHPLLPTISLQEALADGVPLYLPLGTAALIESPTP